MPGYLEAVKEQVVVFDGATGTNLQLRALSADDFGGPEFEGCNEVLVRSRPDVVAELHRSFFEVGVDVVETDSFGSLPWVLGEYGLADEAYELARASARIAREVADGYGGWVAGSLGPGTKIVSLGQIGFTEMRDGYEAAARGLLAGGADLLLVETCQDVLQVKAAVIGCRRAMAATGRTVPLQVQVTIEQTGTMLMGTEIAAALTTVAALRPDVVGLNCATGPREMTEHLRHLSLASPFPISCLPNAGLPSVVDGRMHYDLTPEELASWQARFVREFGVSAVGGCCGTTPEHLAAVVAAVRPLEPARRTPSLEPGCASIYTHVPYDQSPSFLVVGERTNANGSKKFREAMLSEDWDTCTAMGREQVAEGAHVLDLCVDYTGADGVHDMTELAFRFNTATTLPVMLDSTEPPVIEAGLQRLAGKPILNSVNLEEGADPGTRLDRFLALANEYGAAVVCTCIDTEGQARTAEWKLRAARAIHDLAVERYGIPATDLFFDALALPLSTGMEESRRDGVETIEGIRLIKASLPGVRTILGLSNISFGLNPAARQVLNSVFLHEAQQAGLDAAIVHAGRILPLNRIDPAHVEICLDLVYDRRREGYDPLSALLAAFEGASAADSGAKEDRSDWPVERRLSQRIIDGDRNGLTDDLASAMASGWGALDLVNDVLLAGMKTVGDLFASGEMQLPFVLQSAETMKAAVSFLEPHMPRVGDSTSKGRIVLATVKGDVHDIGKNLVDIILTNNGYEVHNLGIKVGIDEMVSAAASVGADAIGMSGLLVKSTLIMRDNLEALNEAGLSGYPVILGGAALTRTYVERDLRAVYQGRLFYGKDAFEGLRVMDQLGAIRTGAAADDPAWGREPGGRDLPARSPRPRAASLPPRAPSVAADAPVPTPPFWGSRVVRGIAVDDIAAYLNETALFRTQWGFRPEAGENDEAFRARVRAVLRGQLDAARTSGVLMPQVVYGYLPANADGDDVVIWSSPARESEVARFTFPRQQAEPFLCIADFFRPVSSGDVDVAAFHIVSMGPRVTEAAAALKERDRYTDYLFLHGLGVEMTEGLAELWHRRVREELGIAGGDGSVTDVLRRQAYQGGRYSWGYPACPDLEDNLTVATLLDAARIDVEVGAETGYQYQPEQTTSAIICHHPQAKYFVA
ncbi:MAG TPA: methionine synthase [Acidimicrobiales bacterium]|nr:methionine synthase [Acidimicrobiales bacterium]